MGELFTLVLKKKSAYSPMCDLAYLMTGSQAKGIVDYVCQWSTYETAYRFGIAPGVRHEVVTLPGEGYSALEAVLFRLKRMMEQGYEPVYWKGLPYWITEAIFLDPKPDREPEPEPAVAHTTRRSIVPFLEF